MLMLFGWTPSQWGAAKAEYFRVTGAATTSTLDAALEVQEWWQAHRLQDPMETHIIGADKPEVDFRWAAGVFKQLIDLG